MQVAVASYACPTETVVLAAAKMLQAEMPCAGEMTSVDPEQPALCHAHCAGEKNTDKLSSTVHLGEVSTGISYSAQRARVLQVPPDKPPYSFYRTTAPPLTVRHCCFRI